MNQELKQITEIDNTEDKELFVLDDMTRTFLKIRAMHDIEDELLYEYVNLLVKTYSLLDDEYYFFDDCFFSILNATLYTDKHVAKFVKELKLRDMISLFEYEKFDMDIMVLEKELKYVIFIFSIYDTREKIYGLYDMIITEKKEDIIDELSKLEIDFSGEEIEIIQKRLDEVL